MSDAAMVVMPLGIFKGQTVEEIGATLGGLETLEWYDAEDYPWLHVKHPKVADAVRDYLGRPDVIGRFAELLAAEERNRQAAKSAKNAENGGQREPLITAGNGGEGEA